MNIERFVRLFKSMPNVPFGSVYPTVCGFARQTNWIGTGSGGFVPSSITTLPEMYAGRSIVSGDTPGVMFGVDVVVPKPRGGVEIPPLLPAPPPVDGGGGLTCPKRLILSASPTEQRKKIWVVMRSRLPVTRIIALLRISGCEPLSVWVRMG